MKAREEELLCREEEGERYGEGSGAPGPPPSFSLPAPWCLLPGDSVTCRSGSSSHSPAPAYPAQQRSRLSEERELHCR